MPSPQFETIVQELGRATSMTLAPDKINCCKIKLKNGISLLLEDENTGRGLLITAELGIAPPGKYRELLFTEMLVANGQQAPRYGSFGYSKQTGDLLFLFDILPYESLTGEKLRDYLGFFVAKALKWKQAMERGEIPQRPDAQTAHGGLFGLKR